MLSTLVTVTIDTEEEWDWDAGWPAEAPSVSNVLGLARFQEQCSKFDIATTYFTNYAVMNDAEASSVIRQLSRTPRVEIGMHIHPWNTPPIVSSDVVRARESFLHNLPDQEVCAKLSSVLGKFQESGLVPTSFRGGRYSTDERIQDFLRDRGFSVDASTVPYTTWPDEGAPDFRERGLLPVRRPPRRPGDKPLWEIPLSLGFTRGPFRLWSAFYGVVEKSLVSRLHLIGILERLCVVKRVWLNFECQPASEMCAFLTTLRRQNAPSVSFMVHSSSLVAGKGPYTKTVADEERMYRGIEQVFGALRDWPGVESVTMAQAATRLEERFDAGLGN